ncbi:MAG TPA: hypothetical protein PK771_00790 [Spirochaetota bacterium]|nr:hypothetical protein [Spirochaetota bacterium]
MKRIFLIIILFFISLFFLIITFLLFLRKGNNFLLRKKLQIGALIISLTTVISGSRCFTGKVTCYDVAPARNYIYTNDLSPDIENNYKLNLSEKNIILFNIKYEYKRENFTYRISRIIKDASYDNKEDIIYQKDITDITTDKNDSALSFFTVEIDKKINPDKYFLIITDDKGYDYISMPLIIEK